MITICKITISKARYEAFRLLRTLLAAHSLMMGSERLSESVHVQCVSFQAAPHPPFARTPPISGAPDGVSGMPIAVLPLFFTLFFST
jgi:hypothetical protein